MKLVKLKNNITVLLNLVKAFYLFLRYLLLNKINLKTKSWQESQTNL